MRKIILHSFAFLAGVVCVYLVQFSIMMLWAIGDIRWGGDITPSSREQQWALLTTNFISGTVGPMVSTLICREIPWVVLTVMCLFGLTIDVYAVLYPLQTLPAWFRVAFVVAVPVQIVLGGYIGARLLSSRQGLPGTVGEL